MNGMGRWTTGMAGLMAVTTTATAQAESQLGPIFGAAMAEEPQSGALAVVGLGLLVLSAFAKRRRDP